ncbi:DUF833-domain-containing protein [Vararia minispora EC-137]|uniref:DUF833-domain-containing protein n=1 Tax=Vararia minispora EC-137 TaxID=1314806 RepID=A0ACB8QGQ4_9AGAM|nr:DUF833-domain-containing protein [Vararia minispora EC-137]
MCVGFWSLTHPDYALILCTNRDEYLDRPTAPAHWHNFEPVSSPLDQTSAEVTPPSGGALVLSGRDLLAGGTWLGINRLGRVGFLTNITEAPGSYPLSRGALLSNFLLQRGSLNAAVEELEGKDGMFAGFNMLAFAPVPGSVPLSYDARFITDGHGGGVLHYRPLRESERAACGLSNGVDGKGGEAYPKILAGTAELQAIISSLPPDAPDDALADQLLDMLTSQAEPAPRDAEGRKSSISITPIPGTRAYGTRVSSVMLVRRDGSALFVERDRWVAGERGANDGGGERRFQFSVSGI